jgi:hypothetical protein
MRSNYQAPLPIRAIRLAKKDAQSPRFSWSSFVASLNSLRERPIRFTYISEMGPNKNCVEWLKSDPLIYEWVKSSNCLRSPRKWPKAVLPAFKHRLIPTPFDICNVDMRRSFPRTSIALAQYLKVLLYCLGFSMGQISTLLGESERDIERDMYCIIETFFEWPQFILWASATNFKKSLLPPHLSGMTITEKAEIIRKLTKNPFLLSNAEAAPFLESPRYLTYLVYGSPKKPRVTKGCRLYYTKEG